MIHITKEMALVIGKIASEIETAPLKALKGLKNEDRVQAAQTIACILRGFLRLDKDAQQAILNGDSSRLFTFMDIEATLDTDAAELLAPVPDISELFKNAEPAILQEIETSCLLCGRPRK